MFLKIPVYLRTNDEFLLTDAKSSRWLQKPEKNYEIIQNKTRYKVFTTEISFVGWKLQSILNKEMLLCCPSDTFIRNKT